MAHLRHLLFSYLKYYNGARTHLSLEKDAPVSPAVDRAGHILCRPILAGCITNMPGFNLGQAQLHRQPLKADSYIVWRWQSAQIGLPRSSHSSARRNNLTHDPCNRSPVTFDARPAHARA